MQGHLLLDLNIHTFGTLGQLSNSIRETSTFIQDVITGKTSLLTKEKADNGRLASFVSL